MKTVDKEINVYQAFDSRINHELIRYWVQVQMFIIFCKVYCARMSTNL